MTFKLSWAPPIYMNAGSPTVNYCHLCMKQEFCYSTPGIPAPCYDYKRHWFREKLDMILHDHRWYRKWCGGAWVSYFVDGVAGHLHEPARGATPLPGHMHAVQWEFFPPARKPIMDKFTEVDR